MFQKSVKREMRSPQFQHLSESFRLWLETLGYKPKTVKLANWCIQEFFSFLEGQKVTRLRDFTNQHPEQYLDYLQHRPNCIKTGSLSTGYMNKHVTTLRLFGKYLGQTGKAAFTIKPELFKTVETATYLTQTEIQALYKAACSDNNLYRQRDTAMLSLFYGCGLRASEGEALTTGDILFEKALIYVRKGKNYRERYVPMSPKVKEEISAYLLNQRETLRAGKPNQALLLGRRGERWKVAGMYQRLQWLKKQTHNEKLKQKSFGLHILRHSIATHLLQDGMRLENIALFLGHKSIETTQKYTHLANDGNF
jgi:integrase/recombinase XerD